MKSKYAALYFLAGAILGILLVYRPSNQFSPNYRVLVTANHIAYVQGYTKVYEDPETDYSIYVDADYQGQKIAVGATVHFCGTTGEVQTVTAYYIDIAVADTEKILPGVSGSTVTYNNIPIAFVSGWNGEGAVRAYFY